MIDWERVHQLQDEVGEEDFQEVAEMFLDEVGTELDGLTPELNASELEAKLHFLKGAALNLGLKAFAEICQKGEELARKGQNEKVDTGKVISCYHTCMIEFSSVLTKGPVT